PDGQQHQHLEHLEGADQPQHAVALVGHDFCHSKRRAVVASSHTVRPHLVWMFLAACGSHSSVSSMIDAAQDAPPDSPPDAGPCGLRAGPRGMSQRTMMVAGLSRTYIVYLPDGAPATPMPLVFVHH